MMEDLDESRGDLRDDLDESPPFMPEAAPTQHDDALEAGASVPPVAPIRVDIEPREWVSPGVSLFKQVMTGIGVTLAALAFVGIGLYEKTSMWVSTIIGIVFIGGFVGYLRVVAPKPFTLRLDPTDITRADKSGVVKIPWGAVAKVREEQFKSGKTVSLALYKRVGQRGLHRVWIIFRDDVPDFEGLMRSLRDALPASAQWVQEVVPE